MAIVTNRLSLLVENNRSLKSEDWYHKKNRVLCETIVLDVANLPPSIRSNEDGPRQRIGLVAVKKLTKRIGNPITCCRCGVRFIVLVVF